MALGSDDVVDMNRRAWERVADQYDRRERVIEGILFGDFMSSLPVGGRVLDVGSGTGLPYAGALVEGGFDVLGVDVSSRMVELARGHVPGARFVELSMTEMAFKGEFDGVLAVYSMLLLDPPLFRDVAGRVVMALRGGGVF
jgi:SAM-dependent methyltransferase